MPDDRGALLVCPACAGPMIEVRVGHDQVMVALCDSCSGVWLDWFAGEPSELAGAIPSLHGSAPMGRRGGACPRDGASLEWQPYLHAGPMVERCPTCFGLFADRARVPELRAFHARMPDEQREPIHRESLLARLWHAFAG
ncbi:MAG TPA: zf-TFIIB domain-containing protein [Polyangia bacterium]|nr:zf-TFIIB domain-containing protein [Polyangia bacterium]